MNTLNNSSAILGHDEEVNSWIKAIERRLDQVFEISNGDIPKKLKRSLFSITHYKNEIHKKLLGNSLDSNTLAELVATLETRAIEMTIIMEGHPIETLLFDAITALRGTIEAKASSFRSSNRVSARPESSITHPDSRKIAATVEILKNQILTIQNENNQARQSILKTQKQAERTAAEVSSYDQRLNETFSSANEKADKILQELITKQKEVNDLVGMISGETVAGSYAKSAGVENKMADAMRNGSVLLMLTIVLIIGYSLLETVKPHFEWETALFRLLFSLALSVPAAYLARESSKHREQQYSYLSTSLDLQAITPYIASLPPDEQHRLKVEVANRLFGPKEATRITADSYPINLNEILLALLSKVELPKNSPQDK